MANAVFGKFSESVEVDASILIVTSPLDVSIIKYSGVSVEIELTVLISNSANLELTSSILLSRDASSAPCIKECPNEVIGTSAPAPNISIILS